MKQSNKDCSVINFKSKLSTKHRFMAIFFFLLLQRFTLITKDHPRHALSACWKLLLYKAKTDKTVL